MISFFTNSSTGDEYKSIIGESNGRKPFMALTEAFIASSAESNVVPAGKARSLISTENLLSSSASTIMLCVLPSLEFALIG